MRFSTILRKEEDQSYLLCVSVPVLMESCLPRATLHGHGTWLHCRALARYRMSLDYTLRWITQRWRNNILDHIIQNCFIKSTVTGHADQKEGSLEALQLVNLYQTLTERLTQDAQEVMSLMDFLDPSDEDYADEPDLSDIILGLSSGGDDDCQDSEDLPGPPPDLPSSATVINSMQDALLWAQHQEAATEANIRQIEGLIGLFTRLRVDGRKQKTLEEMAFTEQ
ncbi:hypothetical protein BDV24DRAFT_168167 [Aspergillus arachidicola]|uniref:Uncharacterized protein n=1 Tax=Aspergillus arachidicola TaxID=656916 RepID=A0A5N6XWA3_9EURO|nr:hypothetical protein BDV24DRAFT_168167 [Aspergillus arachidicola]